MITLIGHGYIGKNIAANFTSNHIDFNWIGHKDLSSCDGNPGLIINAAGYTGSPNVDSCEINRQDCIKGNVIWPLELERKNTKNPIIHISSGCIYNGYPCGGYTEFDAPNLNFDNGSFYSATKSLAQELLQPYMDKSYLFRIRMPFGRFRDPKNFLSKLEYYEKLVSFENSLTCVDDLASTVLYFVQNRPEPGIYNVCNPGSTDAKTIADMMGLKKHWFTEEEFKNSVKAPRSNCVLSTKKLESIVEIRSVHEALEETIIHYN